jgi:hypothetical protein
VHGRGRCDRTLASGRPAVAIARTAIAGPARAGTPAWSTTPGARGTTTGSTTGSTAGAITPVTTTTRPVLIAIIPVFVTSTGPLA